MEMLSVSLAMDMTGSLQLLLHQFCTAGYCITCIRRGVGICIVDFRAVPEACRWARGLWHSMGLPWGLLSCQAFLIDKTATRDPGVHPA